MPLDKASYQETPEISVTKDGSVFDYLEWSTMIEYEFEYDAKSAGTHFIFPLIKPIAFYAANDENKDSVKSNLLRFGTH